jgi:predicted nucleic acid-binding protein
MIYLDTSFLIRALVPGSAEDHRLRTRLRSKEIIAVSAIVWAEFLCGPVGSHHVALATLIVGEPVPFLPQDAMLAARLFNLTGCRRGTLIDCMIAATAIRQGAALATSNLEDFRRFEPHGLRLASP